MIDDDAPRYCARHQRARPRPRGCERHLEENEDAAKNRGERFGVLIDEHARAESSDGAE
jgi:hypothetical protein